MRTLSLQDWHLSHGALTATPEVATYGDPAAEWARVRDAAALFDASARARLLVTGDDRVDFVQGLCTNDLEKLAVGGVCEAAFITPKGRLVADARVTKIEDALVLDLEDAALPGLVEQFAKYRIHEQVEWSDASDDLVQLELWGPRAREAVGDAPADGASGAVGVGEQTVLAAGTPFGLVLFVPAPLAPDVAGALLERLGGIGGGLAGREAVDVRRCELGLGRWGLDWDDGTNPLEAGLDRTLDYKKGCYVGQEVVAKATYVGHVNRRLVRLAWEGDPAPRDTPILGGRAPGRVTSSVRVPGTDRVVALGVVRRDVAPAGSKVRIGDAGPEATVTGYPWRSGEKPIS